MGFFNNLFGGGSDYLKGAQTVANNIGSTFSNEGNTLFGQSQSTFGQLNPYFSNLLNNPQGLGATTLSQMLTSAGQSAAGGQGAARQRAFDLASRTGNTSAIPGIIGGASKEGISTMADVSRDLATKNAMLKLQQQQEGASGLSNLFKTNLGTSIEANKGALSADQLNADLAAQRAKMAVQGQSNMFGALQGIGDTLSGILPGGAGSVAGQLGTFASLFV